MQFWALASGSSGNCYLLESEGTRLLVECGRPMRDVLRYLVHARVTPESLDGILLTHAHGDHCKSAREISDSFSLPIYASAGTLGSPTLRDSAFARAVEADRPFTIGEVEVHPFPVPHDCYEPLGYQFESHSGRVCLATDLGWVPDSARRRFEDVDVLAIEANYDPYMLHAGRYPAFLKQRVAGNRGHLSNIDAGEAIAACGKRPPRAVWLAHISENNNTPAKALATVGASLAATGLGHVPVSATRHRRPSLYWTSVKPVEQLRLW